MRVADYIFDILAKHNISNCFSVTGRGSLFLNDALKKNGNINSFFMHHEQSAAFASISNAQLTGKISACLVSTGCASTNTITGLLSAWQDSIPTIFISGQNTLNETTRNRKLKIKTFGQQEADIISLVKPITKYAVMINNPNKIEQETLKAINLAQLSPKGPVWIDIPLDIQDYRIEHKYKKASFKQEILKCGNKEIEYVYKKIKKSKRPAIVIGNGIKSANAKEIFVKFCKKFNIPVVYTHTAPDTFSSINKLSIGSLGSQGCSRAAAFTVQNSDLLLVLGSRMNSLTTGIDKKKFARKSEVIAVDINKHEFSKGNIKIDKLILCDLYNFLIKINKYQNNDKRKKWINKNFYGKKNSKNLIQKKMKKTELVFINFQIFCQN